MKKNLLIGGASVASACAVIGLGAAVSAGAMAPEETEAFDNVTVAMVGFGDGTSDPIQCTFEGVGLPFPIATPAAEGEIAVGSVSVSGGDGPASVGVGDIVPNGPTVIVGSGAASVTVEGEVGTGDSGQPSFHVETRDETGTVVFDGELSELPAPPAGAVFISSDDVREGSAEECAELREQFETVAP